MDIKVVSKFISWYKAKSQKQKDFASALMISKLTDDELLQVKKLTDDTADELINIFDRSDKVKKS